MTETPLFGPRMSGEQAAALRAPFPAEAIGKLPRTTHKDMGKSRCDECGNYLPPHVHLDYVGHAWVTHRLLEVDPNWDWEPVPNSAELGLPTPPGTMWIRLTVCGVTRFGVGDAQGKTGPDAVKEMIGDALRNAAMRFGVALDLWMKDRNASVGDHDTNSRPARSPALAKRAAPARPAKKAVGGRTLDDIRTDLRDRLNALPEPHRGRTAAAFRKAFGDPLELKPSQRQKAEDLVHAAEVMAASQPSAPPGGDPPPPDVQRETVAARHLRMLLELITELPNADLAWSFTNADVEQPDDLDDARRTLAEIMEPALTDDYPDGIAGPAELAVWWNGPPIEDTPSGG